MVAALDLPGLVLWGETALATWRPQSGRLEILAGVPVLAVEAVWGRLIGLIGGMGPIGLISR